MAPNKPKLHKSSGKSVTQPVSSSSSSNTLDPEMEQQFESELCWCIQQLQISLNSGKLNQKQVQENTKILNTLMSNSTPFIKKRQVMRLTFGDYRAKMAAEDKKLSKVLTAIKISPGSPNKNSKFVKKSLFATPSGNNFKFNFNTDNGENSLVDNISKVEIKAENDLKPEFHSTTSDISLQSSLVDPKVEDEPPKPEEFHFTISDNSFRFNFKTEES